MSTLIDQARALIEGTDGGHTEYQIRHFMVGKHVTPWAKYQQCLAEIRTRLPYASKDDPVAARELAVLVECAETLRQEIGPVDSDRRRVLESETWYHYARKKLACDLLVYKGVSEGTLDLILSLHPEARAELLGIVERADDYQRGALRSWLYDGAPALEA